MPSIMYVNPIFWLVAVSMLIGWARFATWLAHDVSRLQRQSELQWKFIGLGVLLVATLVWILVPWFALAMPINVLLMGGIVAWYWMARVGELGARGHLFSGTIKSMGQAKKDAKDRRAARAVSLVYLRSDDTPMPLPEPGDPSQVGLTYADQMVSRGMERRADDIDLTPGPNGYDLKLIVDGVAFPQAPMERNIADPLIQSVKSLAGLVIEERRRPQQGTFKVRDPQGNITRWTVRTSGTTAGERLSLAANEKGRWDLSLDQLGFMADQLAAVRQIASPSDMQGVVLVASPRSSGRSSTLYALLRTHDAFTNSVNSLEANPQVDIEGVTVTRFDARGGETTYAKALNSVFLKDPDIVMSAQCPDAATAGGIAKYAASGHLVYVGLPAFDTMAALELWLQLIPDRQLASASLRGIISQRLVRVLCPTCKTPYQPDEATLRRLNLPVGRNLQSFKANTEGLVDAKGNRTTCPDCSSIGYRGRTGIFEVFVVTDEIRTAIADGASIKQVQALARKNSMSLLVESGIRKFAVGLTSINEVLRVVAPDKGTNPSAGSGIMQSPK